MILLDTSALLYWANRPEQLSSAAFAAIENADRILISSISLWEIGIKARKGKLTLPTPLRQFAAAVESTERVRLLPVHTEIWLRTVELDWRHRDPADRVIVATAQVHNCPLVTSDRTIRAFYQSTIW